jgi:very-short-patch-repair endonuclease
MWRQLARESLEAAFQTRYIQLGGVGEWARHYRFLADSGYQLDFAMPDLRIGVEINGGQWQISGHSSGRGLHRDADKQNRALVAGWSIFWLTTDMLDAHGDPVHVQRVVDVVRRKSELRASLARSLATRLDWSFEEEG